MRIFVTDSGNYVTFQRGARLIAGNQQQVFRPALPG